MNLSRRSLLFYLEEFVSPENYQRGYNALSNSNEWEAWLIATVPNSLDVEVRRRLRSNLKHILVGLEMKCGLITPHGERDGRQSVLFEPYFNILIFEFCVGTFSVAEGLGSAFHLDGIGDNGATGPRIRPTDWIPALEAKWDPGPASTFSDDLNAVKETRDKLHQDRLALRADIDWHAFSYDGAFASAKRVLRTGLNSEPANTRLIPEPTNLR